jgi:hypothetical protein
LWNKLALDKGKERKAMASMIMLVSWKVWKEHNARVIRHHYSTVATLVCKIKEESRVWSLAGATKKWAM